MIYVAYVAGGFAAATVLGGWAFLLHKVAVEIERGGRDGR